MTLLELEDYLHRHIPISQAMAVRATQLNGDGLTLEAPLLPNLNHRGTAFGGSVSTLAILAAWSVLHVKLTEAGYATTIVIQHNETTYLAPVQSSFSAFCPFPPMLSWAKFLTTLQRHRKSRLTLQATITSEGKIVGQFNGNYVAIASPAPDSATHT